MTAEKPPTGGLPIYFAAEHTTPVRTHRELPVPAIDWSELTELEPELVRLDRLVDLLLDDQPLAYYVVRDYAAVLVGWGRGRQASGRWVGTETHDGLPTQTMADLDAMAVPETEPATAAEAWLRTSQAYDLALDYLIARLEGTPLPAGPDWCRDPKAHRARAYFMQNRGSMLFECIACPKGGGGGGER